jgi:hypothetical protein
MTAVFFQHHSGVLSKSPPYSFNITAAITALDVKAGAS